MTDLLIRNINEDDVRAIDALATRLGLSRNELLRRETMSLARRGQPTASREDFERAARLFSDALDDEIMSNAW